MGERQSKAYWQKDEEAPACNLCGTAFTFLLRRHHCRNCGFVFCKKCSSHKCPIPMRGISESVRVCDPCFSALIASSRGVSGPPAVSTSGVGLSDEESRAPLRGDSTTTGAGGVPASTDNREGSSERNSSLAPLPPAQQQQQQQDAHVDTCARPREAAAEAEVDETANDAYQDAYGAESDAAQQQRLQLQQRQLGSGNAAPEQLERELLARQWATVRQETHFVDILVQRAEKVEPTSMVEYSRETEAITLQPEVSVQVLGATVLPFPPPVESSARYLMEQVKLWTKNNSKHAFLLCSAADSIVPKLQPNVPVDTICRACPTQFSES